MPIIITNNTPTGVQIGPGSNLQIGVDGDIEAGDSLIVGAQIVRGGTEFIVSNGTLIFNQAHADASFNVPMHMGFYEQWEGFPFQDVSGGSDWPTDGQTVTLIASFVRGLTTITTESFPGYTWQGDAATQNLEYLANRIQANNGTLTSDQEATLLDIHSNVDPPFVDHLGAALTGFLTDQVIRPGMAALGIDVTSHVLTGNGTLDMPNILGAQTAWGLVMDVTVVPPGASRRFGYVDKFPLRMAQFLLLHEASNGGEAMVVEEYDLHLEHFTWVFNHANIVAVAYSIEPMAEVTVRFVQAFNP